MIELIDKWNFKPKILKKVKHNQYLKIWVLIQNHIVLIIKICIN